MPSPAIAARNRVAVAARLGDRDAERTARQDLAAAKISALISRVTEGQPPLRPEQRDALIAQLFAGRVA